MRDSTSDRAADDAHGIVYTGIGGWTFAPWRASFYPVGLPQTRELEYATSKLTTIEVNGTFYRTQKPETFAKWASSAPEGFIFSLKAPRYAMNRKRLAEAEDSINRFVNSGLVELGGKLGPILWQFAANKQLDLTDFEAVLEQLPVRVNGVRLRHAVDLRHPSFACREAVELCRAAGVAIVYADSSDYPEIADITADFIYARLQRGCTEIPTGYPPSKLDEWAERARVWAAGRAPADLTYVDPEFDAPRIARDVFAYFIREGKARAPHAAMALRERLERQSA